MKEIKPCERCKNWNIPETKEIIYKATNIVCMKCGKLYKSLYIEGSSLHRLLVEQSNFRGEYYK